MKGPDQSEVKWGFLRGRNIVGEEIKKEEK